MTTTNSYDDIAASTLKLLLENLPTIKDKWNKHLDYWKGEERGYYNDMAVLAQEIVALKKGEEDKRLKAFFNQFEILLTNAPPDLEKLLTVGLLEDIQTLALGARISLSSFEQYMSDELIKVWRETYDLWPTFEGYS